MARPITVEKPLKAKERRRLQNNSEIKAPSHSPPKPSNISNHGNENNEPKVSSKSADGYDKQWNNSARHQSASSTERRTALDKILNSADVATDVDTGHPVFAHDEQRNASSINNKR